MMSLEACITQMMHSKFIINNSLEFAITLYYHFLTYYIPFVCIHCGDSVKTSYPEPMKYQWPYRIVNDMVMPFINSWGQGLKSKPLLMKAFINWMWGVELVNVASGTINQSITEFCLLWVIFSANFCRCETVNASSSHTWFKRSYKDTNTKDVDTHQINWRSMTSQYLMYIVARTEVWLSAEKSFFCPSKLSR